MKRPPPAGTRISLRATALGRLSPHRARRTVAILAVLLSLFAASCDFDSSPVAPDADEQTAPPPDDQEAPGFLSSRTHVMEPGVLDLVSRSDSANGIYRYSVMSVEAPNIQRDEFIVGRDGDVYLRRVIRVEREGDELRLETSKAYWHEVIEGGTYEATIPLGGSPASAGPMSHTNVVVGGAPTNLPGVSTRLDDLDVCLLTDALLALIPGNLDIHLCGVERNFSVGVAAVGVTVDGTITELFIDEGLIEVTGTMATSTTIDPGGLSGGRAPVFAPCNRANYPGCLTTPTGALLIDFFRQYVPEIPDGALSPVRLCIPLTPIRIRAGYWYWTDTFIPLLLWWPAQYELCRVTDFGVLPTVELPSLQAVDFTFRPEIKGRLIMDVKGTGGLQLKVTVPGVTGATAGAKFGDKLSLKGTIGLFLAIDIDMSEAGLRTTVDFDEGLVVTTNWTKEYGWTGDVEVTKTDIGGSIDPAGADSVRVRAGLTVEITGVVCAALIGTCELDDDDDDDDGGGPAVELKLGAEAGAVIFRFVESQWSRTATDNWMIDTDAAYELDLSAGLSLPLSDFWLPPSVPIAWDPDPWDFLRTDIADLYGTGRLEVVTTTTGPSPDTDGYQVLIEREDTLPRIIESGAVRLGPALDWGLPLHLNVDANDRRLVFPIKFPPCGVVYSDLLLNLDLVANALLHAARRLGIGPPNYAIPSLCLLLIADHRVTLGGVAENCTVTGGRSQVVALQQRNIIEGRNDLTSVEFNVVCTDPSQNPLGALDVSTTYTGSDPDTTGYFISINGAPWGRIGAEDQRQLPGLTPGTRSVFLDDIAPNCSVEDNPRDVTVPSGGTATVTFVFACTPTPTPAGAVRVSANTTGPTPDADGYTVHLDGEIQAFLDASGSFNLPGLTPGNTAVLHLGDVADNCRLGGLSPTTVILDPSDLTAVAPFDISCTDSPITTVTGSIFIVALPAPTAMLRMDDGTAFRLTGDLAGELAHMSGVPVAVHGVQAGGALDVYGYTPLASPAGDGRRVGIVIHRDGEYWLFGEGAVRLVDPPARLVDQVGRLVWVTGVEVGAGLVPEGFGIIREGR